MTEHPTGHSRIFTMLNIAEHFLSLLHFTLTTRIHYEEHAFQPINLPFSVESIYPKVYFKMLKHLQI